MANGLGWGLDWHGVCVYSSGVAYRRLKVWVFEDRQEALAYADKLYQASLLREQIEKAMEDGWISQN